MIVRHIFCLVEILLILHASVQTEPHASEFARKFRACWTQRSDWTLMFSKSACHAGWEHHLSTAAVRTIDFVERVDLGTKDKTAEQNGALKVSFGDAKAGQFKVCDSLRGGSTESWRAEVISHAIDRVLRINRVPAVVPRTVDIEAAQHDSTKLSKQEHSNIHRIGELCQHHHFSAFYGSMMGWAKEEVVELEHYNERFTSHNVFDVRNASQETLEFVRMVIELFVFDMPHKFKHNVMKLKTSTGRLFLVSLDNDRAHWVRHSNSQLLLSRREMPACDRKAGVTKFHCHHFGQDRPKLEMRHLASFIESACIFPRSIASVIKRLAGGPSASPNVRPSHLVKEYIRRQQTVGSQQHKLDVFDMERWNSTVLDLRVQYLGHLLRKCIERHGYSDVIIDSTKFGSSDKSESSYKSHSSSASSSSSSS